jgi:hypothetical protein
MSMFSQKKYCSFASAFSFPSEPVQNAVASNRSYDIQDNTPPMPLFDAHLGGFFFLGHG